ncbi:hypothetical protein G7054_g8369 [Neopestalotiopsis clavispora]|nr:hypothetical protein G7054_g8369 [Neopestalotiopsis clavispora]
MLYENLVVLVAGIAILAYGVDFVFGQFDDPGEPRRITPKIPVPIIGHILGVLRYGFNYYNLLSQTTDEDIYSLGILNFKVYITRNTRLANLVQKSKALSFTPFLKVPSDVVSSDAHQAFDGKLLDEFSLRTKEALTPGPHLDAQNLRMARQLLADVTDLVQQKEVNLFQWAKHAIVQATAVGLYGAEHPFVRREVEDALWVWEEHRPQQMLGIDPLHTGSKARTQVFEAFREYFQHIPDDASYLVTQRDRLLREGGIKEDDRYKIQATLSNAAYPNTVPTLFWTIYQIYSRPDLLKDIRQELFEKAVTRSKSVNGKEGLILDVAALQTECFILLSAYQETQRTRHSQVAWRVVTEDTMLDQYVLKKGNYLQMPVRPVHESQAIWGPTADVYDPYRFVPARDGEAPKARIVPSTFLPWGAPPHLCPARQFASTEILIAAALLILRARLDPVGGKVWERRPAVKSGTPALPRPKKDVCLKVTPREEGLVQWSVVIGKSKARIHLASG